VTDNFEQFYVVSVVSNPYTKNSNFIKNNKVPLEPDHLEKVIFTDLNWCDFAWGPQSVIITGKEEKFTI
jgi:hypothetical protein